MLVSKAFQTLYAFALECCPSNPIINIVRSSQSYILSKFFRIRGIISTRMSTSISYIDNGSMHMGLESKGVLTPYDAADRSAAQ